MRLRAALVIAALLAWAPLLASGHATGPGDWAWFHHTWEACRVALLAGEPPLWDPFHCGGVPLWGQPQSMHLAPTWWLTGLLFGTALGSKLFVALHAVAATLGLFALARVRLRATAPAAALAAIAWGLGGFFAWRVAQGHAPFLAFAWMPWALFAFDQSTRDLRYAALTAAALTLMVLEGGGYAALFTALALGVEAALRSHRGAASARALAIALGLFALTAAARLWPIAVTLARYPRPTGTADAQPPLELVRALVSASEPDAWSSTWSWGEHAASVTVPALVLAAVGALVAIRRPRARSALALTMLFGALALGDHGPASPWPLLHRLPGFDTLHVPFRFAGPLSLYVALLAASGLDACTRFLRRAGLARTLARSVAWSLVLAVALESIASTASIAGAWSGPPIEGARETHHHLVAEDYLAAYASYPRRNVGTASCYDPLGWPIPETLREGEGPQARLHPASAGEVEHEERTPTTFTARATATEAATLLINQRFDADWTSDVGDVVDHHGQLAVRLDPGRHVVRLRHAPADRPWSLVLSALGVVACVMWWRRSLAGGRRPG